MNNIDFQQSVYDFLNSGLAVLLITLLISLISAYVAYRSTRKIRIFDLYAENKIKAYTNFFNALCQYQIGKIGDDEFAKYLYLSGVFSQEDTYVIMSQLFDTMTTKPVDRVKFTNEIAVLVAAIRIEIVNCKKFNFKVINQKIRFVKKPYKGDLK